VKTRNDGLTGTAVPPAQVCGASTPHTSLS